MSATGRTHGFLIRGLYFAYYQFERRYHNDDNFKKKKKKSI